MHDFKIILQDRFQFLLSLTAKYILCYDKSTNAYVKERYKSDEKCQKIFPFLYWKYKDYSTGSAVLKRKSSTY